MAWVKAPDGRYIDASPAWSALLHLDREDIVAKRDSELPLSDSYPDLPRVAAEMQGIDKPHIAELTIAVAGGWRFLTVTGLPIHDDAGAIVAIGGVATEAIASNHYTSALECLLRIGNSADVTGRSTVTDILGLGRRFFGLPVGLVGRVDGDDYVVEHVVSNEADAESGARLVLEETFCAAVTRTNDVVALHDTSKAPADICPTREWMSQKTYLGVPIIVDGAVYGTVVFTAPVIRDRPFDQSEIAFARLLAHWLSFCLERNRRILEIEKSRAELQLIFDHVPVYIIHKNAENVILRTNRAMAEVIGSTPEEMTGMRVDDVFDVTRDELLAHDRIVLESGKPLIGTIRKSSRRIGKQRWERMDKIPYDDPHTGERTILAVFSDITELMTKEQALERANEDLRQFAYAASHDLQEPFRKIRTFADVLRDSLEKGKKEDAEYALRVMEESARRGGTLVDDLLHYAWTDNVHDHVSKVPIAAVIDEVLSELWLAVHDADAEIIRRIDAVEIEAVSSHIRQIVQNFVSNALKFRSDQRRPEIVISVTENRDRGIVRLCVADNGIGFDPKYEKLIFEPFGRLHPQSEFPGSGLGLALCARLAARGGWVLGCVGRPGVGAEFSVEFPAVFTPAES